LAFGNEGKLLLTAGKDNSLQLWNVKSKKLIHKLWEGIDSSVSCIALSSNGLRAVAGTENGEIRAWNTRTGELLQQIKAKTPIVAVASSNDGEMFAWAGKDNEVRVIEVQGGKQIRNDRQTAPISALAFKQEGKTLVIGVPSRGYASLYLREDRPAFWMFDTEQMESPSKERWQDGLSPMHDIVIGKGGFASGTGKMIIHSGMTQLADHTVDLLGLTGILAEAVKGKVAFTADGKHVVAFGGHGAVDARTTADTSRAMYYASDSAGVTSTAIAEGARIGASGLESGQIELWNIPEVPPLESEQVSAFANELWAMLNAEQFEELDRIASELLASKDRFSTGERRLLHYYAMFQRQWYAGDTKWEQELARLTKWAEARPESSNVQCLLGAYHIQLGWAARGGGFANTVRPEDALTFEGQLEKAARHLEKSIQLSPDNPETYALLIKVGQGLGWEKPRVYELVRKSQEIDPEYFSSYVTMAEYLLPRWYGEQGEIERWAAKMAEDIGGDTGNMMYFKVLSRVIRYEGGGIFRDHNLSYERARDGGESYLMKYPANYQETSLGVLSNLAKFAFNAGDREGAKRYFTHLDGICDLSVWGERAAFEYCRDWSNQPEPSTVPSP
jgi:hypothetical protein